MSAVLSGVGVSVETSGGVDGLQRGRGVHRPGRCSEGTTLRSTGSSSGVSSIISEGPQSFTEAKHGLTFKPVKLQIKIIYIQKIKVIFS